MGCGVSHLSLLLPLSASQIFWGWDYAGLTLLIDSRALLGRLRGMSG
nr:MAG TPA: hypothetical protein [Caudoviricetes sp.]